MTRTGAQRMRSKSCSERIEMPWRHSERRTARSASICVFSSDYPHVEGGRNPIKRFDASLTQAEIPAAARQRFYAENFVDLMGEGLTADLRYPRAAA